MIRTHLIMMKVSFWPLGHHSTIIPSNFIIILSLSLNLCLFFSLIIFFVYFCLLSLSLSLSLYRAYLRCLESLLELHPLQQLGLIHMILKYLATRLRLMLLIYLPLSLTSKQCEHIGLILIGLGSIFYKSSQNWASFWAILKEAVFK